MSITTKKISLLIRNFHITKINREFLIFFFFLVISCIFWFINAMNNTYETEVLVPVKLVDIPTNVVVTSDMDDCLHVTIHEKGFTLLKHYIKKEDKSISFKFDTYNTSYCKGSIPASALNQHVKSLFKEAQIISIKPERLDFSYNYGENKKVPIVIQGNITTESRCYLSDTKVKPDSVIVYAESTILDSIKYVRTKDINLTLSTDTVDISTDLKTIKGAKIIPENINIKFCPDIYTTEVIKVPIRCINVPKGKIMRTFPSKAAVKFISGMKNIRKIKPADFEIITDYSEIVGSNPSTCHLMLISIPNGVTKAQLLTTNVDYLIEE